MNLVFIHGRAQQGKNPVKLKKIWENAFYDGLNSAGLKRPDGLKISFPFYGDELDRIIKSLDTQLIVDINSKGGGKDSAEGAFQFELIYEIAEVAGLSDDQIMEYYDGSYKEKGPLNWKWVHAILKALDASKKIGNLVLDKFTRDVFLYLTNPGIRNQIDNIILPFIIGAPCVVVGHSLGSIIGYNVLHKTKSKVVKYITLGSPLGIKSIKRKLMPLKMPLSTESWFNGLDPDDLVALYPLDNKVFPIVPSIKNKVDIINRTANQHGIQGYLNDSVVAKHIIDALEI